MDRSLVTTSALEAMEVARGTPQLQPSLALLRNMNPAFFQDLEATLRRAPQAADMTIYSHQSCQRYRLFGADVKRWLALHPEGVIFPMTIAAANEPGTMPAPMRLLLLIPVRSETLLQVPREYATQFAQDMWGDYAGIAQGDHAAFLVGMYAHEDGTWEYGPVVGWVAALEDREDAAVLGLPMLPDLVEQRMRSERLSGPDAVMAMMSDYFFDEIGFLLFSSLPEGRPLPQPTHRSL